ncbi:MAG: ABC transporter ATP-binding protein [Desulfobacteraceae bacterium 4572_35.1]|nr:MAG: ABC transporter ATP-binding protein [Desulfobacteraceae bacterium 4572_35.1]
METVDLSLFSLGLTFLLLVVPVLLSLIYRFALIGPLFYAVTRMSIQLILVGIFLKYLFLWNNTLVNLLWLTIMVVVAVFSAIRGSSIKISKVAIPAFASFFIANVGAILYINSVVIRLDNIFDAKYLIVLGGMLLGNSLRGNVVGITTFYKKIRSDSKKYLYVLSLGASHYEALLPYLRESVQLALKPTLASMATMGIVALPGMMTGVILGGASPEVAIKYQIMIMVAIVVSTITSVVLTILMTLRVCFNRYGVLRQDVFVDSKTSGRA